MIEAASNLEEDLLVTRGTVRQGATPIARPRQRVDVEGIAGGTFAIGARVAGFSTSKASPDWASTHSPISICWAAFHCDFLFIPSPDANCRPSAQCNRPPQPRNTNNLFLHTLKFPMRSTCRKMRTGRCFRNSLGVDVRPADQGTQPGPPLRLQNDQNHIQKTTILYANDGKSYTDRGG